MFVLTTISDLIQISPRDFRKPSIHSIEDNIHKAYANKVIQGVGLCICLWDLVDTSEGLISQGDGMVNVNVKFRLIVFRPFRGEILQGIIIDANEDGIRISLDFFEDVWIPAPTNLFETSKFTQSEGEKVWVWTTDPDADDAANFYFDKHETVRFRVESEIWHDHTPQRPDFSNPAAAAEKAAEPRPAPYTIIGSIQQPGLGPVHWWLDECAEEDAEDDAEGGTDAGGDATEV